MTKAVLEIEEIGHRHVKADIVIVELRLAASGAKRTLDRMPTSAKFQALQHLMSESGSSPRRAEYT